jgi:Fur family ferric uptake transcriptional regulator
MSGLTVDDIIELVRAEGGRATPSRRAILHALIGASPAHPTAELLTASVQQVHPDVAASTVYRFLDELGRLGVVRPVRIGDGPVSYHLADDAAHHHLRCTQCGSMTEVPDAAFAALRRSLRREVGFEIDAEHLTLNGICSSCRPA